MKHREMKNENKQYQRLMIMILLSFISMYIFMYSMVDSFANVFSNLNQFYMAAVMTAPMVIIELLLMGSMYMNKKLNSFIVFGSIVALIGFFTLIRQQAAITQEQFLKSMIPHHAGAILMCEQSSVQNETIKALCKNIISSQKSEIGQMKSLLHELEK